VRNRAEAGFVAAAVVLASAGAAVVLKIWNADLRAPFAYDGDGTLNLMLIRNAMDRAWFYENPDLGAPSEQHLYDYPVISGDGLHVLFFWLAGLFTDNPALVMNLFFLLTFPLTAVAAYLVLRRLAVRPDVALVFALLYTLLPYHFFRGETHVFLAAYYAVPVGAYLALAVLDGRLRIGVATGALAALVAVASGSFYYSVFTVLLVAVAALLRFVATRERSAFVAGGFVAGVILAVSLVQLSPTIVYRVKHGTNEQVAQRYWFESENYGIRLTQLLLPLDGHRIDALAERKAEYAEKIPQSEGRIATLGFVGAAGFLWLLAVAVAACVGAARGDFFAPHRQFAALTVVAVLVGTTGGLSTLIAVAWPQIRAWNRLSVFIAFFALAAIAILLERLRRRIPKAGFVAVLGALLVLGAADQTSATFVPPYEAFEGRYRADEQWIRSVEARLPTDAAVVQLPYVPFPEPPRGLQDGYDPAKAYLHSSNLRWSYGAMRGRPDDWGAVHGIKPAAELVPAARDAGFAAILVDLHSYPDRGAQIAAELRAAVGEESEQSPDGRYSLFEL
jgi:hypothetical protein